MTPRSFAPRTLAKGERVGLTPPHKRLLLEANGERVGLELLALILRAHPLDLTTPHKRLLLEANGERVGLALLRLAPLRLALLCVERREEFAPRLGGNSSRGKSSALLASARGRMLGDGVQLLAVLDAHV